MHYIFTTEIPRGHDRRIHMNYAKTEFIDCGPISGKITANGGRMPTTYGFLQGIINSDEGGGNQEYIDAIFAETETQLQTEDSVPVKIVGMFEREDGDHKVLVARIDSEVCSFDDIDPELQKTLLDFHGFHKKITAIHSTAEAIEYLSECSVE